MTNFSHHPPSLTTERSALLFYIATQNFTVFLHYFRLDCTLGGCPKIENLLRKSYFGHIFRSFSFNRTTICLK